jgi:CRP-like cAMP-binding protein
MINTRAFAPPSANRLLALLPAADFARLRPHLRFVQLDLKHVLLRAGQPVHSVYFPTTAEVCALTVMKNGSAIDVGTVGNEGMVGLSAALGVPMSPYLVLVQVAGDALRMDARVFAQACEPDGPIRRVMFRYYSYFLFQVSQSAACNGLHSIEQRCCRWLLVTQDRVGMDAIPMTHEFLATMLGVRRVSVTLVLRPLQEQGLIRTGRGQITILDRERLEAAACECYRLVRIQYDRLLGKSVCGFKGNSVDATQDAS